jgi:threonine/homoserine/homoserine lactone efflux protein
LDATFFLRGLIVGFSIAAPVGPIGALCIRRTITYGRLIGFASGMGAATADGIYGAIAAFGLTVISGALLGASVPLRLVGGLFLAYLGVRTFLAVPRRSDEPASVRGVFAAWASTFGLTLTNPATIFSFLGVFAGLGLASGAGGMSAVALVVGVFLGSATWWLTMSLGLGSFRERLGERALRWVNRISGTVIALFGAAALASLLL